MARIYPLFSSSKANATFIGDEQNGILIDCGASFRKLSNALEVNKIPLSAVKGVFITHEHSDHISGLKMLTKKTDVPVYSLKRTLIKLCELDKVSDTAMLIDVSGKTISCGGCEVTPFSISHDAVQPCGFRVKTSDDKYCAVCTDTGYVTQEAENAMKGCRLVLIEANYDENMLRNGDYPLYLKERILSDSGHLSNQKCAEQIKKLINTGTFYFILGHLSQENNTPQTADSTVEKYLSEYKRNLDYKMGVAPVETKGGAVIF